MVEDKGPAPRQWDGKNCPGWNVYAGSCQLDKGHKGKHVDRYGETFRATPMRKRVG